jgi:ketol-acid reductoisomerase
MKIIIEQDVPGGSLDGRLVVVAGYGNQGRPQALNLRDSGVRVEVAAREGRAGWRRAAEDGFVVRSIAEGAAAADVLLLLVPDEVQGAVFRESIAGRLRPGAALCFAHGFAVTFGEISSRDTDIVLVAPKGQGARLRESYREGSGLACLIAVENDVSGEARRLALGLARELGCLRIGAFETTFREETISDLFGEQAVLCGGVPELIKKAFDTLVRHGCSPEVAYFECYHELKIIVDIFTRRGFSGMRELISGTAAYGGLRFGARVVGRETESALEHLYERIESGEFARRWLEEARRGGVELERLRENERELLVETAGTRVRKLYSDGDT